MKNLFQFKTSVYVSNIYEDEERCKTVALEHACRKNVRVVVFKYEYCKITKTYNFRELIAEY